MSRDRVLVLDENLNTRLAAELRSRGRRAESISQMGLAGRKDPDLLEMLSKQYRPEAWVLVTADDRMPFNHADTIKDCGATVATIDTRQPVGYNSDEWLRDVVQRWAHLMQLQQQATVRRYSFVWHRLWTKRRSLTDSIS